MQNQNTPDILYTKKTVVDIGDVKGLIKEKPLINDHVYWSKRQRQIWVFVLFFGSVFSYVTRVAGPVTVVAMGQDLAWDKTVAVSIFILYYMSTMVYYIVYIPSNCCCLAHCYYFVINCKVIRSIGLLTSSQLPHSNSTNV